jgi:hypothetical protein
VVEESRTELTVEPVLGRVSVFLDGWSVLNLSVEESRKLRALLLLTEVDVGAGLDLADCRITLPEDECGPPVVVGFAG